MNTQDLTDFRSEAREAADNLYDLTVMMAGLNNVDPLSSELDIDDISIGNFLELLADTQAEFRRNIRMARQLHVRLDQIIHGQQFEDEEPINFIRTRYPHRSNPSSPDFLDSYVTFTRSMLDGSHDVAREIFRGARNQESLRDFLIRRETDAGVIQNPVSGRELATLLGTTLPNRLMESGVGMNPPQQIIVQNPDRSGVIGVLSTPEEIEEEEDWERALRMGEGGR